MRKLNLLAILAVLFTLNLVFVSCKDEEDDPIIEEEEPIIQESITFIADDATEASVLGDQVMGDADYYIMDALDESLAGLSGLGFAPQRISSETTADSVVVTFDPELTMMNLLADNIFPNTITVDFDTAGVTGISGNILKGRIIMVITGMPEDSGTVRTYTFDNFYVNDDKILGEKEVTSKGMNDAGNYILGVVVSDTIQKADGAEVTWTSEQTREWFQNGTDTIYTDDWYSIIGSASGVNASGKEYTMEVDDTDSLIIYVDYNYFVGGSATCSALDITGVINFGDGTKDKIATITVDSITTEFTME